MSQSGPKPIVYAILVWLTTTVAGRGEVISGKITDWQESGPVIKIGDGQNHVSLWWSLSGVGSGHFYGSRETGDSDVAFASGVTDVSQIVDASSFKFVTESVGPLFDADAGQGIGQFVVWRNSRTGQYGVLRIDDIHDESTGTPVFALLDGTWWFETCGTDDFASQEIFLQPDSSFQFQLDPSQPRVCFRFPAQKKPFELRLTDADQKDVNSIFLRWDGAPLPNFDLAANAPQAEQSLLVSRPRQKDAFVLVQGEIFNGGVNTLVLENAVRESALFLEKMSATSTAGDSQVHAAIEGGGFEPGVVFLLRDPNFEPTFAVQTTLVSRQRAEVVFDLSGLPVGPYDLQATLGGFTETLQGVFEHRPPQNVATTLAFALRGVEAYRRARIARLTLEYENLTPQEMRAPLFWIVGPKEMELDGGDTVPCETGLALDRDNEFHEGDLLVLGTGPNGVAGWLPAGARGEIPIRFETDCCPVGSSCSVEFQVFWFGLTSDADLPWDELSAPPGLDAKEWEQVVRPALSAELGPTWRSYHEGLTEVATRLSRRGEMVSSVKRLFCHQVQRALLRPSSAILGRVTLAETGEPLADVSVLAVEDSEVRTGTTTDSEGTYALDWVEEGKTYEIAVAGHAIVSTTAGGSFVTVPAEGDFLGLDIEVKEEANGLVAACPVCDESGLPREPLFPPRGLFPESRRWRVDVLSAWDPNEKEGPRGEGEEHFISGDEELEYTVYFENRSVASLPAQVVEVTDNLDPAIFDLSTFRLREVQIGGNLEQRVALDRVSRDRYSGRTDAEFREGTRAFHRMTVSQISGVSETTLDVDLEFDLDLETGQARWFFETVTDDPLKGFLLPNDELQQGEGSVSFAIRLKPLPDDTDIENQSELTFDDLPTIQTNVWTNRIGTLHLFRRGDSDGDGSLTIGDAIFNLSYQFLGGVVPHCLKAQDFNDDGTLDLSDPISNLSHQFLGTMPPRFPGIDACGSDPTEDLLSCEAYPQANC